MKKQRLEALLAQCEQELEAYNKKFNRCSFIRAAVALVTLVSLVAALSFRFYAGYALCGIGVAAFLFLIAWHNQIEEKQNDRAAEREVLQEYLARFGDGWKQFARDGREYLAEDFPQARDLDLFGKASLYQYLCTANTVYGADCLARWLRYGAAEAEELKARQKAVEELAGKQEFSICLQSLGKQMKQKNTESDKKTAEDFIRASRNSDVQPIAVSILMWGFPVITLFFLFSSLFGVFTRWSLSLFFLCFLLQLLFVVLVFKRNGRILNPVYRFYRSIAPYQSMLALIEQESFQSGRLCEIQMAMQKNGGASSALKTLKRIGEAVNARHNGLAFLLYNGLLLWDFHCADRFIRWRDVYGAEIEAWLQLTGELEALISLSVLCNVKESYCFPQIIGGRAPYLSFQDLKHPLIAEGKAVGNDLIVKHGCCMITGSNMSGKTTFLRSVGISLFLAYAGGPVLAQKFSASRMTVLTSMRVEDSVSEGISNFYAELLRIKEMIRYRNKGKPMLALIDEIYKGTNSRDRILGATETLRRLSGERVLLMVTTHDFELCDLENDPAVLAVNYHFTEHYKEDEILFDYKMRPGRCRTTNARHLLRLAGIL